MFDQYERRLNLRYAIAEDLEFHDFGRFILAIGKCAHFVKPSLVAVSIYAVLNQCVAGMSTDSPELWDQALLSASCGLGVMLTSTEGIAKVIRDGVVSTSIAASYIIGANYRGIDPLPRQAIGLSTLWFWGEKPTLAEIFR